MIVLKVTYNDGSTEEVSCTDARILGDVLHAYNTRSDWGGSRDDVVASFPLANVRKYETV